MSAKRTILAVDAGNSRVKWGLHDGERFIDEGWRTLSAIDTLEADWGRLKKPGAVFIANVAGEAVVARLTAYFARWQIAPRWVAGESARCGVANRYDNPAQLGPDRWAALIAAHSLKIGACVVVCSGTATTIDALTATGEFLGGLILPGIDLMHDMLTANTSRLGAERGSFAAFPRATRDAITSGAIQATCGAVQRMCEAMISSGHADPTIVASGAAADTLARHLERPVQVRDKLILEGLIAMAGAQG
ncbi:MAG: type III pantothenate kinase [Burkholderiales bacterium]